jgi:hypothetical protein
MCWWYQDTFTCVTDVRDGSTEFSLPFSVTVARNIETPTNAACRPRATRHPCTRRRFWWGWS